MKHTLRNLLYFTRTERRGILLLCVLILLGAGGTQFYLYLRDEASHPATEERTGQARMQQEYADFLASVQEEEQPGQTRHRHPQEPDDSPGKPALTPFPFDPNTADSLALCRLGLPGWMARNIVRYRERGGRFRRPEDFRKIYGLTDEQYQLLHPYIRIARRDTARAAVPRIYAPQAGRDTLPRVDKYPAGTVVDLNRADTTELMRIPGIGSGIARLIAGYRQRLGGFYSLEQLRDIDLDPGPLRPWLRIDTTAIRRINLNRADVERLRRHPYFNFYQAKAIVERRRKHGPLRSLKVFAFYEEFTEADFERMRHYVSFE